MAIWHLKQFGKVKKLSKWVPYELTTNCCLKVSSFLILHNSDTFLDQIAMCDEKWILYGHQLSSWIEKKLQSTSQSQTCTKKKTKKRPLFAGLLPGLIHYGFLNPGKTITSEKNAQ